MRRSMLCLLMLSALLLVAQAPAPDASSLRAAEVAFAASVRDQNKERFAAAIADDAIFLSGNEAQRGKAAILKAWEGFFGPDRDILEWHPEVAEVQSGGELGITRGPWKLVGKDKDGNVVTQTGRFNSVWRRQKDGGWKVIFDLGCSPCACAPTQ